ncbi:MAG: hypothetical protein HY830_17150 [Actinobacteria bacterium]|nr:hypothetical protein [Actinomycetota bacterium]
MRRTAAVAVTAVALTVGGAGWAALPAAAAGTPVTYADHTYPSTVTAPTADKPQSKVWRNDNAWWSVLISASAGVPTIHELRGDHTWRDTGVAIDTRAASTADTESVGSQLYVASRSSGSNLLFSRFTYVPASRTYARDSGFPVTIATGGSESLTIARDTVGTVWATWTRGSRVYLAHTTTSDTAWTAGTTVPVPDTTLSSDDISGIVSFNNSVGIMWSDQQSVAVRFAIHDDGDPDTAWRVETPLSGGLLADDHINLKSLVDDVQGRVFAAVKTSKTASGDAIILVLKRTSSGTWTSTTGATKADGATRPQIVLDSEHSVLYLLMTAPEAGGTIYYKSSPLSSLSFSSGRGSVFMQASGAKLNNVSTTRDPVTSATGLVAIASDDANKRYYHTEMSLADGGGGGDTTPPTAPGSVSASASAPTTVDVAWTASTDAVGVSRYEILRNGTQIGTSTTLAFTDTTAAAATTYTYGVRARDAAGNVSTTTSAAAVTTPSDPNPPGSVTFRSASTFSTAGATALTVAKPAGLAAGDVVLATVSSRGAPKITAPAGWTLVGSTPNSTTMVQAVYSHVAGASEPASWTWTLSKTQVAVVQLDAYSGVSTAAPVRAFAGQANASSGTVTAPAVTANNGDLVVALFGTGRSSAFTPQAGLVERSDVTSSTGSTKVSGSAADRAVTATGTVGPFTATTPTGSAANVGQTVVLAAA